jgi:signal transduction histidine kinase
MTLFSSLWSRIFLTSVLLAVLSIGVAIYLVSVRVTREAESALQREIAATGALVDQLRTTRTETFTTMARLVADIPKLKAAASTNDPQTVQDTIEDYQRQLKLNSNMLLVTNKTGRVLAIVGASSRAADVVAKQPAIREALAGHESTSLLPQSNGILQLVTVPIEIDPSRPEGTLSVGVLLDDLVASQLKAITGSDVAFGMDGQILASTLTAEHRQALASLLREPDSVHDTRLGVEEYVVLPRRLSSTADADGLAAGPVALILRSRTEQLAGLQAIHRELAITAVVAVLLATVLSFAVARTITRPLATITDAMRDMAATGDLARKIVLHGHRWEDEDARLLAATFNTLTDSIARFQREIGQKERLSSLGRLSTVIAHEIRNPLMIIKASLRTLRQPEASETTVREAVSDIDDEVVRLNRLVNEVLDFARPISFELAPTDVNRLCTESASAAQASGPGTPVGLALDPTAPTAVLDAERLRIALVNMLVNARHAVAARRAVPAAVSTALSAPETAHQAQDLPPLMLRTESTPSRVTIVVADRGVGIAHADLPHVFDPYFTTRRGGTGLGLAIAKNIVEGLRGTIAITSVPDVGTEIRIDLPRDAALSDHQ